MNKKKIFLCLASGILIGSNITVCNGQEVLKAKSNKYLKYNYKYDDDKYDEDKYDDDKYDDEYDDDKYDNDKYDEDEDDEYDDIDISLIKGKNEKSMDSANFKHKNDKIESNDLIYLESKLLYRYTDEHKFYRLTNKQQIEIVDAIKNLQALDVSNNSKEQLDDFDKVVYMDAVNTYEKVFDTKLNIDKDEAIKARKSKKIHDKNSNNKKIKLTTTKYTEIKNVDHFDTTPIAYNNQGYIVLVNHKYGFINNDGEYIVKPQYPGLFINNKADSTEKGLYFLNDAQIKVDNKGILLKENNEIVKKNNISNGGYGGVEPVRLTFDGNKAYVTKDNVKLNIANYKKYMNKNDNIVPTKVMRLAYDNDGDKAFITPNNQVIELDDDIDEGSFIMERSFDNGSYSQVVLTDNSATGLVSGELKDKDVIVDKTGVYFANVKFKEAKYTSVDSMQIINGANKGIIVYNAKDKDNDYNGYKLAIYGRFEDVSKPIKNKTYIKKDGKWQLVKLQ